MKPLRKRVSFVTAAEEAKSALRDVVVEQPRQWIENIRERMRDLPKTNFDLGCRFAEEQKWFDAMFRFRVTLFLQPEYPQALYNLGCSYYRMGKPEKAKEALLKALAQAPGNVNTIFMLATIDPSALPPEKRPTRMPESIVTGFFGSVAEGYDIEEAKNKYVAGKMLHDLLKPLVTAANPVVIDLGCGTGIVSRPWRAAASSITGVDITPAMIAQAEKATHAEKKLFDQLLTADIAKLPQTLPQGTADLVLIVNVAQFVGDLAGVMQGAAGLLNPQGMLAITVEPYRTAGFGIAADTSRFGHANSYVKQQAANAGLTPVKEVALVLYPDTPVQALVFAKGTN